MKNYYKISILFCLIILSSCKWETKIIEHPFLWQSFIAGESAYYLYNCNAEESCWANQREKEIDRSFSCADELNGSITSIYNSQEKIDDDRTFTLLEIHSSADKLLVDNYTYAVLEDSKWILSTVLFWDETWKMVFGFQNWEICN